MHFGQMGPVDRVAEAVSLYAIQEAQAIAANPVNWTQDTVAIALKQRFYEGVVAATYPGISREERRTLRFVRFQTRRMDAKLAPTWWRKLLYHPVTVFLRNAALRRGDHFRKMDDLIRKTVHDEVRTLNIHAVSQRLSDTGFRLPVETVLRKMMQLEMPHFHFRYNDPTRCPNTEFVLHFERVPGSDYYGFCAFDATAAPGTGTQLPDATQLPIRQTFSMDHDAPGFSAADAATLVNGGAVSRIEHDQEVWVSLDTSLKTAAAVPLIAVPFDLEAAIRRLPLVTTEAARIDRLKEALRSGQSRTVELHVEGRKKRCNIRADPAGGSIEVMDQLGKRVNLQQIPVEDRSARKNAAKMLNQLENQGKTNRNDKKLRM